MGFLNNLFGTSDNNKESSNCSANFPENHGKSKIQKFTEEISIELFTAVNSDDIVTCTDNGVRLHDIPNMIKIEYGGQLARNGANEIYAVIGYGPNNKWENVENLKMQKTNEHTFELLTIRKQTGNINIAFKDSSNHWDNNNGRNYVFYDESLRGSH